MTPETNMDEQKTGMEAVRASVKSLAALGREIGLTRDAICKWRRVPAERLFDVSKATGLTPEIIRPDLFETKEATS